MNGILIYGTLEITAVFFRIQEWVVSTFRQFRCPRAEVLQMHSQNHLPATRSCVLRALPITAFYILLIFRRGVHMSFVYYAASAQGCKYWIIQTDIGPQRQG